MPEFKAGNLFLGQDDQGHEIGMSTERHAITIAGAGSGKGAAVIIPNLKRWTGNALVIDPKGEAVEAVMNDRNKMGQMVYVLDPFKSANIDREAAAACYNPLDELDPESYTIKEDIDAISDGIIKRDNPEAGHWDDGAQAIISGLIAYVLVTQTGAKKSLPEVRAILRNDDKFAKVISDMSHMEECAGLCENGYAAAIAKEGGYFVSNARKNTQWLDSKGMAEVLCSSDFSLSELKTDEADVFLVLPPNYIAQHGRFLRLFVRCAIDAMAKKVGNGQLRDRQCLFLLDEFFTLGYIDEIAKAAGLMRGYGLQLWPILQDLGQLRKLYGKDGAETFFGNADVQMFFGNTDMETLEYISNSFGVLTAEEIEFPDQHRKEYFGFEEPEMGLVQSLFTNVEDSAWQRYRREEHDRQKTVWQVEEENRQRPYQEAIQKAMGKVGKPRLPADEIRGLVGKGDGDPVARKMIVFGKGDERLILRPSPYFTELAPLPVSEKAVKTRADWIKKHPAEYGAPELTPDDLRECPLVEFSGINLRELRENDKASYNRLQRLARWMHREERTSKIELEGEIYDQNHGLNVNSYLVSLTGYERRGYKLLIRPRPWFAVAGKKVWKMVS